MDTTLDVYYCSVGRVTVQEGAIFLYESERTVYFVNSKNYLPNVAFNDFMKYCKFTQIDLLNDGKRLSTGRTTNINRTGIRVYTDQLADIATARLKYTDQNVLQSTKCNEVYGLAEFKASMDSLLTELTDCIMPEWEVSKALVHTGEVKENTQPFTECHEHLLDALEKLTKLTAIACINKEKQHNH